MSGSSAELLGVLREIELPTLGDRQGVLVLPPEGPGDEILQAALDSDRSEPALLAKIAAGEDLRGSVPGEVRI